MPESIRPVLKDSVAIGLPPGFAEQLRAAEDRVFPLAMVDSDRYQRAVTVIGLLAPVLVTRAPTLVALVECGPACIAEARGIASRSAIPIGDLDLGDLVDAARAQRLRDIMVANVESEAEAHIEQARAAGLSWAVVSEPEPQTLGIAPEQRWVEEHLSTGTQMVRSILMDPATGAPRFQVELRTTDGQGMAIECDDRNAWLETADDLRLSLDEVAG